MESNRNEDNNVIKKFLEIKKIYRYIGAAALIVIIGIVLALIFLGGSETKMESIEVPIGDTTFSIKIDINEVEPYAGIEFAVTLSDESAAEFASFTPAPDGASASPFMSKDGLHYFGFYTLSGENIFPGGKAIAGTLDFTGYAGSDELTVTVVEMNVTRLDENKKAVTTEKDSPVYVFTIQRES